MLRVTVQLVPGGLGGPVRTLAVAEIANVGGGAERGDYDARFYGGEPFADYERIGPDDLKNTSKVNGYARRTRNVWDLVTLALKGAGFGGNHDAATEIAAAPVSLPIAPADVPAPCCSRGSKEPPHTCPWETEVNANYEKQCTCCKACTKHCNDET